MDNYFILSSKVGGQVDQSNFPHDKCQVGDMKKYHGDLAHFDILEIILTIILGIVVPEFIL
jgi:hypothetical protein